MKFAVFVLLACLSVAFVSTANPPKITTWGQITTRTLGTKNVVVASSFLQVKTYKFTFPEVSDCWKMKKFFSLKHDDAYNIFYLETNQWIRLKRNIFSCAYAFCFLLRLGSKCLPNLRNPTFGLQITSGIHTNNYYY